MLQRALGLGALLGGLASAAQAAEPACPQPLRIAFLDKAIPGLLNGDGPQFQADPGRFVAWAEQALDRLGCPKDFVRLPQRRLVSDTATDATQVTLYLAYTPERAAEVAYPLRPDGSPDRRLALAETHLALFVRADQRDRVQWDGQTLRPSNLRVGIVGRGVEEPLARAAGWNLDIALSHAGSIAKLRLGRVDVAVLPALSFTPAALAAPPALVELSPPLQRIAFFAPVSKPLLAKHPEFVRRFWVAVCEAAHASPPPGIVASAPAGCQP